MKKTTVEQAVAAIQAADTNSAIWTVLMQCTKYDMVDVYTYVTGQDHKFNMRQKKEHLASTIVSLIMDWRKDAEFKAKSLTEKIEFVKACTPYKAGSYLCKCTDDEVLAIASELGVPERYAQKANSKYFVIDDIVHALRAMVTEQRISGLLAMDDKAGVKEELKDASTMTLNLLVKMAGLDIDPEASDVSREVKEEALYRHYTENVHSEHLAPIIEQAQEEQATSSVVEYDPEFVEDCYSPDYQDCPAVFDDIPEPREQEQSEQPDSYEIGKRIVSLKGNAKAQQALVQECGEEFLLTMYKVFPNAAPIRITMETPNELRMYLCRDVIRVVRDAKYARILLNNVQHRLDTRYDFDNMPYLKGWAKFLEEYAAPKKALTVEERIAYLKQGIRDARDSRTFHRHFALMWRGTEFEANYAKNAEHYTAEIHRLIKKCKELKRQVIKPAVVLSEQYEVPAVVEQDKTVEDIQEVSETTNIMDDQAQSAVTYSDVGDAYFAFVTEETRGCTAGEDGDFTLCDKLEREYLSLLADYRQTDMPEGQEVLKFIRENYHDDCELARKSFYDLNEMAMKCGINGHSYSHSRELVKDLARTANIPVLSDWTSLTIYQKRKQLQEGLHYTWQLRHGMKKLKKLYQAGAISNEDYQAICFVCDWELNPAKNAPFLEYYKEVCRVYGEVKKRELRRAG